MASGSGYGQGDNSAIPTIYNSQPMTGGEGSNSGRSMTLSPPEVGRTLSISPGMTSDTSNEAVGGNNNNFQSSPDHQFGHSHNLSTTTETPRIVRGGFEKDHSNSNTPVPSQRNEAGELEQQTFFPIQDRSNGGGSSNNNNAASGGVSMISDPSSNGYSAQTHPSTSQSIGDFSQLISTSGGGGGMEEVISTTFDESTLRALCDMDVSLIYKTR